MKKSLSSSPQKALEEGRFLTFNIKTTRIYTNIDKIFILLGEKAMTCAKKIALILLGAGLMHVNVMLPMNKQMNKQNFFRNFYNDIAPYYAKPYHNKTNTGLFTPFYHNTQHNTTPNIQPYWSPSIKQSTRLKKDNDKNNFIKELEKHWPQDDKDNDGYHFTTEELGDLIVDKEERLKIVRALEAEKKRVEINEEIRTKKALLFPTNVSDQLDLAKEIIKLKEIIELYEKKDELNEQATNLATPILKKVIHKKGFQEAWK